LTQIDIDYFIYAHLGNVENPYFRIPKLSEVMYVVSWQGVNRMNIVIQNQMSEICKINDIIDENAYNWGLSLRTTSQLSLIMDELLTNIIRYAFIDNQLHNIQIDLEISNGTILIEVIDDGIEFNPLLHPEPDLNPNLAERQISGLGIHLLKKLTNEFSYNRMNGYNIQRFRKVID
jgi:anti-sigma regulatory factor (Ser/Thr protein kinase)